MIAAITLAACGGGGGGGGSGTPDTTAPTVTSTNPATSATGIALSSSISATFSESMKASTITTSTFTLATTSGGAVATGTVTLSGNTATFTPSADLTASTEYTATITTGAQDAAGNALAANKTWSFTTGVADTTPPTVTSTSPADAATGVSENTVVSATFSEAIKASTITTGSFTLVATSGGASVSGTVALSTNTATFTPSAALSPSTQYTATITTGAQDAAGNALAANKTWDFTTGVADTTPPTVSSTSPTDAATGVSVNASVSATFSEAMKASTITTGSFMLVATSGGTSVNGSVALSGNTATFTPSAALSPSTQYTATITTGAQDSAGNALAADVTWSFTTGTASASSGTSYLFYTASLHAVDPATPASPITVEAGADVVGNSTYTFTAATYSASPLMLSNIHTKAIVYAKTNGKLYMVSGQVSDGTPTPVQLSNESAADQICDPYDSVDDYANPDNSQYVYNLPGADATCYTGDDVFKMVRLGMSATDAPVTAKEPIVPINDPATGSILGWLVNDAGALKRCNANFASCGASLKPITSNASWVGVGLENYSFLEIDNDLYVYNSETNTLSASIFHDTNIDVWPVRSDQNKVYFVNNGTTNAIYSAPIDGSAAATQLITAEPEQINEMWPSTNKLVYGTDTEIKTASKTAGPGSEVALASSPSGSATLLATKNTHIYYTTYSAGGVPTAGVVDEDNSNKVETSGSEWVGVIIGQTLTVDDSTLFQTLIRADGYETLGAGTALGGGTLHSVNGANRTEIAALGTIPNDIATIDCFGFGAGSTVLCRGLDSTPRADVLFIDAETTDSMVRITSTPTISETPAF